MKEKEQPLYIDICKDFMRSKDFDAQDKFVYMILKSMSYSNNKSFNSIAPFSIEIILSMIGFSLNSKNKNSIKDSIQKLINAKLIIVSTNFTGTDIIEETQLSKSYFVSVPDEKPATYSRVYMREAYKIINMGDKSKAKIFTVFMEIVSYIYINETSLKFCYPNIETLEEGTGVDRKTIMRYLQQMRADEILYYDTFKKDKSKDKNVYSRWEDQRFIEEYLQDEGL